MLFYFEVIFRKRKKFPVLDIIYGTNNTLEAERLLTLAIETIDYAQEKFKARTYGDKVNFSLPYNYYVNFSLCFSNRLEMLKFIKLLKAKFYY